MIELMFYILVVVVFIGFVVVLAAGFVVDGLAGDGDVGADGEVVHL